MLRQLIFKFKHILLIQYEMLKTIINFFVSFFLFPINIFIIFKNYSRIKNKKNIVIQSAGGFGHTFTMPDLSRHYFGNDILYIWFIEQNRHNINIRSIFEIDYLIIKNNFYIKIFNFFAIIGEKEANSYNFFENILIYLIKIINKKNILINNELYRYIEKKNINIVDKKYPKEHLWFSVYYHLKKNNNYKLQSKYIEEILQKNKTLKKFLKYSSLRSKNVCIYLRNRGEDNFTLRQDRTVSNRNGSASKEYYELLKFLDKENYNIFLTGDKIFKNDELSFCNKSVIDCNSLKKKHQDILKIYFPLISNIYISEAGGGQFFGLYSENFFLINQFPPFKYYNNTHVLLQNIYDITLKKLLSDKEKHEKLLGVTVPDNKYLIKKNNSKQIIDFIKKEIKI